MAGKEWCQRHGRPKRARSNAPFRPVCAKVQALTEKYDDQGIVAQPKGKLASSIGKPRFIEVLCAGINMASALPSDARGDAPHRLRL
jgi:hypothetical protein